MVWHIVEQAQQIIKGLGLPCYKFHAHRQRYWAASKRTVVRRCDFQLQVFLMSTLFIRRLAPQDFDDRGEYAWQSTCSSWLLHKLSQATFSTVMNIWIRGK